MVNGNLVELVDEPVVVVGMHVVINRGPGSEAGNLLEIKRHFGSTIGGGAGPCASVHHDVNNSVGESEAVEICSHISAVVVGEFDYCYGVTGPIETIGVGRI